MQTYTISDLQAIVWGGALLGSGGGGGIDFGNQLISLMPPGQTFQVADVNDGIQSAVASAYVGAPDALTTITPDPLYAAFNNYVTANNGNKPASVFPVETGSANTIAPFLVAAQNNIPVLDADGAGRAVPQLTDLVFSDKISVSPMVLSNGAGVTTTSYVPDAATAESLVRSIIEAPQFGEVGGLALWGAKNASQVSTGVIWGSVANARKVGLAIQAGTDAAGVVAQIQALGRSASVVKTGTFAAGAETISGGFDVGVNKINVGSSEVITIYNQNENMVAYSNLAPAPVIVGPDLICYWNNDTNLPFTNVETAANDGASVSMIYVKSLPQVGNSPSAYTGWVNTLAANGYAGSVPK